MKWAIIASLILHSIALSFVIIAPSSGQKGYPASNVIRVNLSSPPPARGVPKPAIENTEPAPSKAAKVEKQPETARVAEINKQKRPKKNQSKPQPAIENKEPAKESSDKNKGLPQGVELGSAFGGARLDASGFDSPYYLNILFNKINSLWDNPFEGKDPIKCVIYFVVGREVKSSIPPSRHHRAFHPTTRLRLERYWAVNRRRCRINLIRRNWESTSSFYIRHMNDKSVKYISNYFHRKE